MCQGRPFFSWMMTSFFSFSFFSVPSCQKRCERNQQADGSTAARASSSSRERWPGISKALISINRQFDGWGLSISGFPPVRPTSFTILSSTVLLSRTLLLSSRARAREEEEDCGADKIKTEIDETGQLVLWNCGGRRKGNYMVSQQ